jgi:hypothetical protein
VKGDTGKPHSGQMRPAYCYEPDSGRPSSEARCALSPRADAAVNGGTDLSTDVFLEKL